MLITPNLANASQPASQAAQPARAADQGFAQMLNRQQETSSEAAPETSSKPPEPDSDAPASTRAAEARTARARASARPATGAKTEAKDAATEPPVKNDTDPAPAADATTTPVDPALAQWLAHLHLPPAAPADAAGPTGAPGASGARPGKAVAALDGTPESASAVGATDADATAPAAGRKGIGAHNAGHRDEHADKLSAPALREASEKSSSGLATEKSATADNTAASLQLPTGSRGFEAAAAALTATPAPAPAHATAELLTVPVSAAVDSPEFAQAFGVQVSVLAREGVQHAELQMNPVEMGPVSVQIVMDGTQARIDFGADAAGTRQAIEHSLPDLAAALREAGLTLTGGGVSQHANGRGDDARSDEGARSGTPHVRSDGDAVGAPVQGWRGSVSANGVDLYA